jgi:hypothetical protein
VLDEGWMPVTRKKKSEAETMADLWREIGYPMSASCFWEGPRRSVSSSSESSRFCRSAGEVEKHGTPMLLVAWSMTSPLGTPRGRCDEYSSRFSLS